VWLATAVVFAVGSCGAGQPEPDPGDQRPGRGRYGEPVELATLPFDMIPELSGLAASGRDNALLWMVNDAGNPAELFTWTAGGGFRRHPISNARNGDWEDLAAFTLDDEPWLVIGEIGDNSAKRNAVALYFVREPAERPDAGAPLTAAGRFAFVYEDGPRDAEALAVDVERDEILILSKRTKPPVLYRLPLRATLKAALGQQAAVGVARRIGAVASIPQPSRLELRLFPRYGRYRSQPTAMDLSQDGRLMLVLTYGEGWLFERQGDEDWPAALSRPPQPLYMPYLTQPEAAAFVAGDSIFISSEKEDAPLLRFDRR
jgi:hypothetical protein